MTAHYFNKKYLLIINNLRITSYKGIKELYLTGLGKTNIICGKNSSGKSSILEGMVDLTHCSPPVKVNIREVLAVIEPYVEPTFRNPADAQSFIANMELFLNKHVGNMPIWYPNNIPAIVSEFKANNERSRILRTWGSFNYDERIITQYINENKVEYSPLLIPPKRNLATKVVLKHDEKWEPNGNGTLN